MDYWSQNAFDELRKCLVSSPILAYPDYERRFILDTDASDVGIGAVQSQVSGCGPCGSECVIAYASRSLTRPEQRYCVTRKELLAVVEFVHHFRHYLLGREFTLRTDHGCRLWSGYRISKNRKVNWLAGWRDSRSITSLLFIVKDCVIVTLKLFPVFHAGSAVERNMTKQRTPPS